MNNLLLIATITTIIIAIIIGSIWLYIHFSKGTTAVKKLPFIKNSQHNFPTRLFRILPRMKAPSIKPYVELRPLSPENCPIDENLELHGILSNENVILGTSLAHDINILSSISDIATEASTERRMYEIFIEPGKRLTFSKKHPGYFLGSCKDIDGNGRITGQALIRKAPINKRRIGKDCIRITGQFASIIAEKYYLECIFQEIHSISEGINKIAEFQITEYQSKIATLATESCRIAMLLQEPPEDLHYSMYRETVTRLFTDCTYLLNQSSVTIKKLMNDYENIISPELYYSAVRELGEWVTYHAVLLEIMCHIHELKNLLGIGGEAEFNATKEFYLNTKFLKRVEEFHKRHVRNLNIDLDSEVIQSNVWYKLLWDWLWGTRFQYKSLPTGIAFQIRSQIAAHTSAQKLISEATLINQPMRLIFKDGKLYRCTSTSNVASENLFTCDA